MSNQKLTPERAREAIDIGLGFYCNDTERDGITVALKDEAVLWTPEDGNVSSFIFKSYQSPFVIIVKETDLGRFTYNVNQ